MVSHISREAYEAIAFNAVSSPAVNTMDREEQVRPVVQVLLLGQELEVKGEAEVAHILSALYLVLIICQFHSAPALLGAGVPIVELSHLVSLPSHVFVFVLLLERPALGHHDLVLDVGSLSLEAHCRHNFTYDKLSCIHLMKHFRMNL